MRKRQTRLWLSLCALLAAAWIGAGRSNDPKSASGWNRLADGILRTTDLPAGHALIAGDRALLIDAPRDGRGLEAHGIKTIEAVLLTHYHRGVCAGIESLLKRGVKVQAPQGAEEWL